MENFKRISDNNDFLCSEIIKIKAKDYNEEE